MSVKKYVISKKQGNFTIIPNNVLQGLQDYEALGLYCYIASLAHGWNFHKSQLASHGKLGRDRLNRALKILAHCGLVTIAQIRDEKGKFAHFSMIVDDGASFKNNYLEEECAPLTEKPLTENRLLDNSSYKRNTYKTNKEHKENISCATEVARDRFDEFWNSYPKKKDKKRAHTIWVKNKLNEKADLILQKVQHQSLKDQQWQDRKFIPNASTYLNNQRWEDEVIESSPSENVIPPNRNHHFDKPTTYKWFNENH